MSNPCDPAHSAAIQDCMARASIGDPPTLNAGSRIVRIGQVLGERANDSGMTIRFAHEQVQSSEPKDSEPTA